MGFGPYTGIYRSRYSTWAMNIRSYKSIEARSAAALHLKVMSHKATGWVVDGPVLQVTDFCHRRPIHRFSQAMSKTSWSLANWTFA
jgi:hypothetical protein